MLIWTAFVSVFTIFICLIRACFSIFLYKSAISRVKSNITPEYIIVYKEKFEKLTFCRKLLSKLLFSLAFCKKYGICVKLVYLKHSIISINL